MDSSAVRGGLMVSLALILGAIVMVWGLDDSPTTIAAEVPVDNATATADATPTSTVIASFTPQATATPPPDAIPVSAVNIAHAPSEVTVQVANAADIPGLAGNITTRLGQRNYVVRTATNAAQPAAVSTVFYEEGYDGDAREILDNILNAPNVVIAPMPAVPPAVGDPEPDGVNILIIAGADELSQL